MSTAKTYLYDGRTKVAQQQTFTLGKLKAFVIKKDLNITNHKSSCLSKSIYIDYIKNVYTCHGTYCFLKNNISSLEDGFNFTKHFIQGVLNLNFQNVFDYIEKQILKKKSKK